VCSISGKYCCRAMRKWAVSRRHRDLTELVPAVSTVPAVLGWRAASAVIRRQKEGPIVAFGVLFFLGGHLLESTILPLEIAHEHRNYLPMYGILLMLFFYVLHPLNILITCACAKCSWCCSSAFCFNTFLRASKWANVTDLFQAEVDHHPDSALANGEMGAIHSNIVTWTRVSWRTTILPRADILKGRRGSIKTIQSRCSLNHAQRRQRQGSRVRLAERTGEPA